MKLKILSLILAVSFVAAALAGCGDAEKTASSAGNSSDDSSSVSEAADSSATSDKEEDKATSNVSASADNGLGNLTNSGGYAVTDGEWIYFRSNIGGPTGKGYDLMKRSVNGDKLELVKSEMNPWWLNLYDGYFYFCNYESKLSRIPVDGSEVEVLSERYCNYSIVDDGWIYFAARATKNDPGGIYKIKTDGTSETYLAEEGHHLLLDGDWLYYIRNRSLWRVSTDGAQNEAVAVGEEMESYEYVIHDDWLYTSSHRYKLDGSESTEMTDKYGFALLDDKLYYAVYQEGLYRSNLDGTGEEEIIPGTFSHVHALGDKIYMLNPDNKLWYWINTDGSNFEEVTSMGKLGK